AHGAVPKSSYEPSASVHRLPSNTTEVVAEPGNPPLADRLPPLTGRPTPGEASATLRPGVVEIQSNITCPSCGDGNRANRRFCTECGGRLGVTCPACGAPIEPGEKFCGGCGAALTGGTLLAPPAPEHARSSRSSSPT